MKASSMFVVGMWLMTLALVVPKFAGALTISWLWVAAPLWIPIVAAWTLISVTYFVVLFCALFVDKPGY